MKKFLLGMTLGVIVSLAACASASEAIKQFAEAADSAMQIILPEYKKYVENDANLDDASKKARLRLADEVQKTIDEAKR